MTDVATATATLFDARSTGPRQAAERERADPQALARALERRVVGEVRFDDGSRGLYATDASNYRQVPIGVVIPRTVDDVIATVEVCRAHGVPVLARGGGTSLAGQCCNVAVVIDMSKYLNRVLEVDPERRLARVEPGVVLDDLRDAAAKYGLTFGPDPATHDHCTLGGMIGNNSCGVHSVMAAFAGTGARTSDNVESLEVLTYDGVRMRVGAMTDAEVERAVRANDRRGDIVRRLRELRDRHAAAIRVSFPQIPRRVSGYNLPQLLPENGFNLARALVGSESTCVFVLQATVKLIPCRPARSLLVLGFPDIAAAADAVPALLGSRPVGLEGMDDRLVDDMRKIGLHPESIELLPEGKGWLLVEFDGDDVADAQRRVDDVMEQLRGQRGAPAMRRFDGDEALKVWEVRESGLAATAHVGTDSPTWPGWEDAAVPPERLGDYLRELRSLYDSFGYQGALYGHFGQGCVHSRIDFDLTSEVGIRLYRRFVEEAADLVVRHGGSCSGEHGDGQARGELLSRMYPPDIISAFREFKSIWDPAWKMNPGKIIDANRLDADLRLGPRFNQLEPTTPLNFGFPEDGGKFSNVAIRCVGVGKCRRHDKGTMCPSYMATGEEKHSTRGRARLLYEMLLGDPVGDGWGSDAVKDALDLCLACKACKGECPVGVDMAAYKAEFLSHYHRSHRRTRSDYALGWIHRWAALGARMPGLANLATQTPGLRAFSRFAAGITQRRTLPPFAEQTFVDWFRARPWRQQTGRPRVVLWPDTFNNHFHPHIGQAAVEVLEAAGYAVEIPAARVCCGRPMYYFGMLDEAKQLLEKSLATLRPQLDAGVPIVGLEPSCISTFRDELHNFFPDDEQANKLREGAVLFGDFIVQHPGTLQWPKLERKAVLHEHCHTKAYMKGTGNRDLLQQLGAEVETPDSGCCGLAGPFGYERGHYDVSMNIGERMLLPTVRTAARDSIIVTDGFACREQIAHGSERRALHPAEVIRLAIDSGYRGPSGDYPERSVARVAPARVARVVVAGALIFAGVVAIAAWSLFKAGNSKWKLR